MNSIGDGAFATALPLLAVRLTKDPLLVSLVSVATYLPWLLWSLPAGAMIDHYDRTMLIWRAQLIQCLVVSAVAALVVTRHVNVLVLAAAGFLLASAQVVADNAAQSVLPSLVESQLLPKANGTQYAAWVTGNSFIGPPVGGALFAVAAAMPFGVDAVSFAGSAVLIRGLPHFGRQTKARTNVWAGLHWLFRHRFLRVVVILLAVNGFFAQMGKVTLVLLATQTMHVSATGYGLLLTMSAAGSVLGGLLFPVFTKWIGQVPSLVIASAVNAGLYVGIGLAPNPIVLGGMLFGNGLAVTMWNIVTVSLRQSIVPNELLGRVNSAFRMVGWGMMPVGALAGGIVAHLVGLRAPFTIAGVLRGAVLVMMLPALLAVRKPTYRGRHSRLI